MSKKRKKRPLRWILLSLGAVILLLSVATAIIRLRFNGPALADTIEIVLNSDIRGRVEVDSVEWPLDHLPTVVTGGWVPIKIYGLRVFDDGGMQGHEVDDSKRELLLETDLVTAEIDIHALVFGHHDLIMRNFQIPNGGYVLLRQVEEPYPLHLYDTSIVSLASAFYTRLKLGLWAGITATSSKIVELQDFDLRDITIEVIYPSTHIIVENVDGTGFVVSDFSDPLKPKVYFALTPTAERGFMCVGEIDSARGAEMPYRSIDEARANGTLCAEQTETGESRSVFGIPLVDVRMPRLFQLPKNWPRDTVAHDVDFALTAVTPDGTELRASGVMRDYWMGYYGGDYDFEFHIDKGGPLMSMLTDELTGGQDVRLVAKVSGSALYPKLTVDIDNLDVRLFEDVDGPPLNLHLEHATASLDMVTEQGSLENTIARGAGGQVAMSAFFGLDPFKFNLRANIRKPLVVGPYLPQEALDLLGNGGPVGSGRLAGRLEISGDSVTQRMSPLDLTLGEARITGVLYAENAEVLHAKGLDIRLGETVVRTNGSVNIDRGDFDLDMAIRSEDLKQRLQRLGIPGVASAATGTAHIGGTMDDPEAHAELTLSGVQVVRTLDINLDYHNDELILNELASRSERNGLDGNLRAHGRVRLGGKQPEVVEFSATAERLDLARVPVFAGLLGGRLSGKATASGRIDRLQANAQTDFDGLTIAGDRYQFPENAHVTLNPDGSMKLGFAAERQGGGGLSAKADIDSAGGLTGAVVVDALPLQKLGLLSGTKGSPIGGILSTSIDLGGTVDAPTGDGDLQWFRAWFGDAFLGASSVRMDTVRPGVIQLSGTLMQGDVQMVATVATTAPYDTELKIELRRVELDRFASEYTEPYGAHGWVSGTIVATTPLLEVPGRPLTIEANLSEMRVSLDNEDPSGRPAPIQIFNKESTPVEVVYSGDRLQLRNPVTLIGPGGVEFEVAGGLDGQRLQGALTGDFNLAVLQPYLRSSVDSITGHVAVEVNLGGTLENLDIDASIVVGDERGDIVIQPTGQDALITVPRGALVRMTNDDITTTGLAVLVEDMYRDQSGARVRSASAGKEDEPDRRLNIRGGVHLSDFKPTGLALQIDGYLAGKLFVILAPEVFSQASGYAEVSLALGGTLSDPEPMLEVYFDRDLDLTITPRGLRRELKFQRGEVSLDRNRLLLAEIGGTLDGEGRFRDIDAVVRLRDWNPIDVHLEASADTVTYRIPGDVELTFNINDLRVSNRDDATRSDGSLLSAEPDQPEDPGLMEFAPTSGLVISGNVEVVDGRYVRDFNLIKDALIPEGSSGGGSSSKPFYEDIPLLGDARLDLTFDTRSFYVQNNLADIQLVGRVSISGLVRDPKFEGTVRVAQGVFKLPGVRARFTRTQGSVSFSKFKSFPGDTPTLNVTSESDYRDPSGQEHLVTLSISGPLSSLNWDLYTSSGLNKGQTVTMLFSGRTPEELRRTLGDEAPGGRDPGRVERSTDPNENIADQLLKDLAGDFISLLIEDKLRNLTTLDVARLEIGTGSIGFHAEKELLQNLRILADLEQTLRGYTYDVRGQFRLTDRLSFEGEHLSKNFNDDSEEDFSETRVRAVWRRFFY